MQNFLAHDLGNEYAQRLVRQLVFRKDRLGFGQVSQRALD
jgi:hypothetical protein